MYIYVYTWTIYVGAWPGYGCGAALSGGKVSDHMNIIDEEI